MSKEKIIEEARKKLKEFEIQDIVVITAIFADYDSLSEIEFTNKNYSYICFTDNKDLISKTWNIVYISDIYGDPRRTAKIFKILPHEFFTNASYTVWIDANRNLLSDFKSLLTFCNLPEFFSHPRRSCIYDEAIECIKWGKDDSKIIKEQVASYRQKGYPENHGLICGAFFCKPNNIECNSLFNLWWQQVEMFSIRDQLSFNFLLRQLKMDIIYLSGNINDNPYFSTVNHEKYKFYNVSSFTRLKYKISLFVLKLSHIKRMFGNL